MMKLGVINLKTLIIGFVYFTKTFMKIFVKTTDPLIKLFRFITPSFIIKPLVPLYVAWFFYMFRFYLMPYLMGYSVMGMLSFPLESEIASQIYQIFGK